MFAGRPGLEEKGQGCAENTAKETPTRERGRPARMHRRRDSLSLPTMYPPPTPPAGTAYARPKQSRGVIAGRVGLEKKGQAVPRTLRKRRPPGSAGVSPACTAVAYRAERLRWCTGQPRRQEQRVRGQSRTLARLPVESDWRKRAKALPRTLRKRRPPGSAGVSPACTAVAIRSVCLRCITHQRHRREPRVRARSKALA